MKCLSKIEQVRCTNQMINGAQLIHDKHNSIAPEATLMFTELAAKKSYLQCK